MKRASTSLPTPLSPVINTFAFPEAIRLARDRRSDIARLVPTRTGSPAPAPSCATVRAGGGNVVTLSKERPPDAHTWACLRGPGRARHRPAQVKSRTPLAAYEAQANALLKEWVGVYLSNRLMSLYANRKPTLTISFFGGNVGRAGIVPWEEDFCSANQRPIDKVYALPIDARQGEPGPHQHSQQRAGRQEPEPEPIQEHSRGDRLDGCRAHSHARGVRPT
jgi:hypothetical protein